MIDSNGVAPSPFHSHIFLGEGHEKSERRTWAVIWLCGAMMIAEIVGGGLLIRLNRARRRWYAYEHPCGCSPARGARLYVRPQARQ